MKKKALLFGIPVVLGIVFFSFKKDDRFFEIAKNLEIFATLFKEVNALYVDEINPTRAVNVGITAMLKELDPYTNYYTENDIEDYRTLTTGKYNGIGATTEFDGKKHTVVMVYQYSPADNAGLKVGDRLLSIDNISVLDKDEEQLGRLIKGQRGTSVLVSVERFGSKKPVEFKIERDMVKTSDVPHYGLIDETIGYIQLKDFSASSATEIKNAFTEMKGDGMQKLILDLRGNPGGLLNKAVEICNFFIPKGELVVETRGKVDVWNKKYGTTEQPLDTEIPIVVLINGSSASASEIVSGTLQDYDRAVLVGQRSFGKGLVQTTRPLVYNTQLKVTTAKYYIPSGRCIQAIDYSYRNPDGTATKLPDSLRSVFYTKNKRKVLDGGGVDPDIALEAKNLSSFTQSLLKDKLIFDFATSYYFQNALKVPQNNFVPGEDVIAAFETYVLSQTDRFSDPVQKHYRELKRELVKSTNANFAKDEIAAVEQKLTEITKQNLKKYREEITNELALEILSRYHYDKVMKFVSFERDAEVQTAMNILNNSTQYKSILKGK